jgi:hypothetical protein
MTDQEMLEDFVDARVLQAGELGVFIKGNVARAPDEAQAAEDSASFALEGLQLFTHTGDRASNGPRFYAAEIVGQRYLCTSVWISCLFLRQ